MIIVTMMSGPRDQTVRSPAVAGMFYPADAAQCRRAARQLIESARPAISQMSSELGSESGIGAIVPHAGWICSGAVAAEAIQSLARQRPAVDLVVVFGAIHTPIPVDRGVLDSHAALGRARRRIERRRRCGRNFPRPRRGSSPMIAFIFVNMLWKWNCR